MTSAAAFSSYPMGPHLRSYLKINDADYRGGVTPTGTPAAACDLTAFLAHYHPEQPQLSTAQLIDLLDELVSMDLPQAALTLAGHYPAADLARDFRAQLSLAVAAMLAGDFAAAEHGFRAAQALLPTEPAPYVNLVQIFHAQDRFQEAEVWALAGLDAEPNNFALWDQLALVLRERHGEFMPDYLMALAEKRVSWAGLSLAANLTTTGDRYLKANLLARLYHQGEREAQFLIELTAAYGIAGEFAQIPPIVWQAERLSTQGLPWQLHLHSAQAQLALGKGDAALVALGKVQKDAALPDEALAAISELAAEANELLLAAQSEAPAIH